MEGAWLSLLLVPLVQAAPASEPTPEPLSSPWELPNEKVIDLPMGHFPEPDCDYAVHLGSKHGPRVNRQVQVGEPLYHSWSCSYDQGASLASSTYCLMVTNCTVSGRQRGTFRPLRTGRPEDTVPIIDEFGCSLWPNLLPHIDYPDDLDGGLQVNAFALDFNQTAVLFQCAIRLLLKVQGICRRPICFPLEGATDA